MPKNFLVDIYLTPLQIYIWFYFCSDLVQLKSITLDLYLDSQKTLTLQRHQGIGLNKNFHNCNRRYPIQNQSMGESIFYPYPCNYVL